jgi:hypothetical protein
MEYDGLVSSNVPERLRTNRQENAMQDVQEIEAALLELLEEMNGEPGDAHEIYLKLRQTLDSMRATGMPLPDDLVQMEKDLSAEFEDDARKDDARI